MTKDAKTLPELREEARQAEAEVQRLEQRKADRQERIALEMRIASSIQRKRILEKELGQ